MEFPAPVPDFRLLFKALPGFYLVVSPNLELLATSDKVIQTCGSETTGFIGKPVAAFGAHFLSGSVTEQQQKWEATLDFISKNKTPYIPEAVCQVISNSSGQNQKYYWETINTPVYNEAGELQYILHEAKEITEQYKAIQTAKEHEDRFEAVAQATNDAVWDWHLKENIAYWNNAYKTLFGHQDPQLTIASWSDFIHADDKDRILNSIQLTIENKDKFWSGEYKFRCADGSYADIIDRGFILYNEKKEAYRIVGSMQDITLRKQTEEKLQETADFFQFVADTVLALIWTSDAAGKTDYRNNYYLNFISPEIARNPDFHWAELLHPDDKETVSHNWITNLKAGKPFTMEIRILARSGDYRWVLARANPKFNTDGELVKWLGTATDIQEQKEIQAELENSMQRFIFLADTVPAFIWTSNPDGTTDYRNKNYYDFVEQKPASEIDFNWQDPLHPDDREKSYSEWEQSVKTGKPYEVEHRIRSKDGFYRWILSRAQAMQSEDGQILKWFGSSTDIHDQKLTQQSLETANAELKKTNEDLDRFVYTASHDLKLPIINMGSIFEELMQSYNSPDPDQAQLVSMFHKSLEQINTTITDLSEIAKVQKNIYQEAEEIDLAKLVREIQISVADQIKKSGARIQTDFTLAPVLHFSRVNLRSIIYNLVSNSIKYQSPDRVPVITVRTYPENDYTVLEVKDNGLGIDLKQHKNKLFQMFKRFHNHVPGTGLGLYIINRIMQNNNGHVLVESNPGTGSTFRIYFKRH